MSDLEKFFRRLEILRYLAESPRPRSEPEIRAHLAEQGAFHISDPDKSVSEAAMRKAVQRDLRDLWNASSHNPEAVEGGELLPIQNTFVSREGSQKEGFRYRVVPDASNQDVRSRSGQSPRAIPGRPSIPQALALTLTHQFLVDFIPIEHYEALHAHFRQARETLENRKNPSEDWSRVPQRVAIFQRGQQLTPPPFNEEVLNTIYHAIAEGKCVEGQYQSGSGNLRTVTLSPYGVVFRLPKIYLIATDRNSDDETKRQFLVHRFESLEVVPEQARVPPDFRIMPWLEEGGMDIAALEGNEADERYDVKIRLFRRPDGKRDNLIRDLQEALLANDQVGPEDAGDGADIMVLPHTRITFQLVEWILGRGSRVEVLEPNVLRARIKQHAEKILSNYS